MKKRRPQPRYTCGHAKSKHINYTYLTGKKHEKICTWCWDKCPEYQQDNLKTIERMYEFQERSSL